MIDTKITGRCHNILSRAISAGTIERPDSCSICFSKPKKIHGHHCDYSKPLDILWVCPKCHTLAHIAEKNLRVDGVSKKDDVILAVLGMVKERLLSKKQSDQDRKYISFSMLHSTRDRIVNLKNGFEPRLKIGQFIEEVLDFYEENHCPECHAVTTKKVTHKCGL